MAYDQAKVNALLALTLIYMAANFYRYTKIVPLGDWSLNLKELAVGTAAVVAAVFWYFFYYTKNNDMVQGYFIMSLCLAFATMAYSLSAKAPSVGEYADLETAALLHTKPQMLPTALSVATFAALYTYFQGYWNLSSLGLSAPMKVY